MVTSSDVIPPLSDKHLTVFKTIHPRDKGSDEVGQDLHLSECGYIVNGSVRYLEKGRKECSPELDDLKNSISFNIHNYIKVDRASRELERP